MHILITGSQGFIGLRLTAALLGDGHLVSGYDVNGGLASGQNHRHFQGDILDRRALEEALRGVECVIHLAAEHKDRGVPKKRYFEVNRIGTRTVLECAANEGVDKFIFFSSAAVYGRAGVTTEESKAYPDTDYGFSKLGAEEELKAWVSGNSARKAVIIRPAAVFGPGNRANIYRLISRICDGRFIWVGRGTNIKSVAYVENLVEATRFLTDRLEPGLQIYNYSDDPQLILKQLVDLIAEKAQVPVSRFHIPYPAAASVIGVLEVLRKVTGSEFELTANRLRKFCLHSEVIGDKIRSLGFHQEYTLEEGIEKTVRWHQAINS